VISSIITKREPALRGIKDQNWNAQMVLGFYPGANRMNSERRSSDRSEVCPNSDEKRSARKVEKSKPQEAHVIGF
jgi:hypothetical protein